MPVYFIAENENDNFQFLRVKIGRSNSIFRRLNTLKTGSPYDLKLMGWIESLDESSLEHALHKKYEDKKIRLEWFHLDPGVVLSELKSHGISAYIATEKNAFSIVARNKDAVPEYSGAWKWSEVDYSDFCPLCGCSCGLSYNENYGSVRCLKCGIIQEML